MNGAVGYSAYSIKAKLGGYTCIDVMLVNSTVLKAAEIHV